MLKLICARAGCGKSEKIRSLIKENAESSVSRPVLIVPKQFSYQNEKDMLDLLGPKKLKNIDIFSFSRLSEIYLDEKILKSRKILDDSIRLALMSETVRQLSDHLEIFKNVKTPNALKSLVSINVELKLCGIDYDSLCVSESDTEDKLLSDKLKELALINRTYDAIVAQSYFDDTDALDYFNKMASEQGFFRNKTVYIDAFREFTKYEFDCIGVALSQADDVYVSLCTDRYENRDSSFEYINDLAARLCGIASRLGIEVKREFLSPCDGVFSEDIRTLESNLFSSESQPAESSDNTVSVVSCSDIDDECEFTAYKIKELIMFHGYRCRDIAVIERNEGVYKKKITEALKRYNIPVFDDTRRPLELETLFIHLKAAFDCVSKGFSTEAVMRYLKSGLGLLSYDEVSELEKYAIVWKISSADWKKDFTMHPSGFGREMNDKYKASLDKLNEYRKKAVLPLLSLRSKCVDTDGVSISRAVYDFLIETKVDKKIAELAAQLREMNYPVEAQRLAVAWRELMRILDDMVNICGSQSLSFGRWCELFILLLSSRSVGEIPQGLDEITVGSAERIRTENIKAAFLVGVNKNEFPLVQVKSGILTDRDRRKLVSLNINVNPPFEKTISEERFIAYCCITAATERLFLSFTEKNDTQKAVYSEIIETALDNIPGLSVTKTSDIPAVDKIYSDPAAFRALAKDYNEDSELRASLMEYFSGSGEYSGRIAALRSVHSVSSDSFEDKTNALRLFGSDISLSASKIESYYKCPFEFFCRYGLRAEPLREAKLDFLQFGTIVHYILQMLLSVHGIDKLISMDEKELAEESRKYLLSYLDEKMGGSFDKSKRFMFVFEKISFTINVVMKRLVHEFRYSRFRPSDFELKIDSDDVPAYTLPLEEGSVSINGSVDRVDVLSENGEDYIRIIDYKTGAKTFRLSSLFEGLNIQMVLYLIALVTDKKSKYYNYVPAGVLYSPSKVGSDSYKKNRTAEKAEILDNYMKDGKMSGMMLGEASVYDAMGGDALKNYLPDQKISFLRGDFSHITDVINAKITDMGNQLHIGRFPIAPFRHGEDHECKNCYYRPICAHEENDAYNEITYLSHNDALSKLRGDKNG